MSWQLDFAVATGIFLIFFSALISYLISYRLSSISSLSSSEQEKISRIFSSLLAGKGIPSDWEKYNRTPVKIGLQTELYRIPILVKEANGTSRNAIINVSLNFDPYCLNKTWNNSVRVYENSTPIAFQLYDQNFCSEQYLRNATLLFNSSFQAYEQKVFWVYFSDDRGILPANYSLQPSINQNFTVEILPEEKFYTLSVSKLEALKNLNHKEVLQTLGDYKFYLEIGE